MKHVYLATNILPKSALYLHRKKKTRKKPRFYDIEALFFYEISILQFLDNRSEIFNEPFGILLVPFKDVLLLCSICEVTVCTVQNNI